MTPRELIDKLENEDLNRDQLADIAQKLGLKNDKRQGTAMLRSRIIDKAEELEAAFPDGDVYESKVPDDAGTPREIPEDTSPQAADLERRKDAKDISGVEPPKQTGTFTPNVEAEAAAESKAEVESEGFQKPKGRTLMNTSNGRILPWSAALAKRKDMKEL